MSNNAGEFPMSEARVHDSSYEWKIILLLSITFGLVGLDRFVLPIILQSPNSTMAQDLGLTPQHGGTLAGYLGMAWGISAFVMGYMADRVGRRAVIVPAILVFSLMSAASGMVGTLVGLIFARIIMGVAEGPVASTGVAVAVEASKPSRRGHLQRSLRVLILGKRLPSPGTRGAESTCTRAAWPSMAASSHSSRKVKAA